ncbi:metal-dependent transcriptional regulator [Clostridium amazonitimonense]|uniref:metal-dependent transcriptional regulator n=1 Tax=Clostridium amazonitimonense TaxID=1499689 RepID=UPI000509D140|nr:iron dependent repressor, metal binding and dimerization domain protein [Clostridium amazonitimonense]
MSNEEFYTFRGYMQKDLKLLTPSMEDYMEMIYRLSQDNGFTRINEIAKFLNVQPPSATKMIQKLSEVNLIQYEKYGVIILTDEGREIGEMLLKRHNVIEGFLGFISPLEDVLEQTEKLEHSISSETLKNLDIFVEFLKENPEIIKAYQIYRNERRSTIENNYI